MIKSYNYTNTRLIHRFKIRVSELFQKCKTQNAIDYIISIRDILNNDNSDFNFILNKIHGKSQLIIQEKNEKPNQILVKKSIPSWQLNIQENKCLSQFYDKDFWKLYDIMQLQKQYCSNLILFHKTRQENIERLYIQSLERNQRLNKQIPQPTIEMNTLLEKAQQLKTLQIDKPIQSQYKNKTIIMFRSPSPNKYHYTNNRYSFSISPKKKQNRNQKSYEIEINSIFNAENINLLAKNYQISQNNNKQVLQNNKNISFINESLKQKNNFKMFQENFSPQKIEKKQDLYLPEIKSPHFFEQKDITKTILISQNNETMVPDNFFSKKPPLGSEFDSSIRQQIRPLYQISSRTVQTIRGLVNK
ncbi:unnamed protein product [Paramecium sonneborni]|uniref:Uncharacterized protein n=1 Tax=Paramecium sonneborni TaxID=65129 RepID=A0A8S1NQQ9_9CILI|nr:unnamed protein product [Paramecium sonneborni]